MRHEHNLSGYQCTNRMQRNYRTPGNEPSVSLSLCFLTALKLNLLGRHRRNRNAPRTEVYYNHHVDYVQTD